MTSGKRDKRATIHDVASAAGVSAATVSKVLRGVGSVKRKNVQRVLDTVRDLDYRMDPLASGLRIVKRRIIGAVVPELESPFFGALVTGLEQFAEAAGYSMIVASSRESEDREAELVERMNDWRVAGTVLVPVRSERGLGAEKLRSFELQAVLVDRVSADDHFDTVSADNYSASAVVAEFLIEAGHRKILVHGATRISKSIRTRLDGFCDRVRKLDPDIRIDTLFSDDNLEVQRDVIQAFFRTHVKGDQPTAVYSLSQHSTLLVLSELRRRGMSIPDDIAIVGFDDVEWMQITWPSITAVAQPVEAIAQRAVSVLLARIEGKNTGFSANYLEPCRMIVRQSAGRREEPLHQIGCNR